MQIIQKEKIPRKVDKITLVVGGILDRREALGIFWQEYSAEALRTRRRKLKSSDVTLELVGDNDYWAISMRGWWDGERRRPMIEVMTKDGSRISTLHNAILRSTAKARVREIRDARNDRLDQDLIRERNREKWNKSHGYFGDYV